MFNNLYVKCRSSGLVSAFCLFLTGITPISAFAQIQDIWTLEASIRRVIDIAPETRGAQALVSARKGALVQAGVWPNPQIELNANDKIGKDDGSGGTDFTQYAISQQLPLSGRIRHRKEIAGATFESARDERRYRQVHLETQVAQNYHAVQLTQERLRLAELRLKLTDDLQNVGFRRAQAGDLSELENLRLDLLRETAQQNLERAKGAYSETLSRFRAYLGLSLESEPELEPLKPFSSIPALGRLHQGLEKHPALLSARHQVEAAQSGVNLARAERIPDPELRLFREKDLLNGNRQAYNGVSISITVPLWDRNNGRIDEARAQVIEVQSELQILERDLTSRLQESYTHLNHLVEQGEHYRMRVLEPAQQVFDLTRQAYASGEVEILSLIDANNTYFEAQEGYLELLQEAWLEVAQLRLAAGITIINFEE